MAVISLGTTTLTRTISGTVKCRLLSGYPTVDAVWCDAPPVYYADAYVITGFLGQWVASIQPMGLMNVEIKAEFEALEETLTCPEMLTTPNMRCHLWAYLDYVDIPAPSYTHRIEIGTFDFVSGIYAGIDENDSISCSLTVEIPVEIFAETTEASALTKIWRGHTGQSPYGLSHSAEVYYVPTGNCTITQVMGAFSNEIVIERPTDPTERAAWDAQFVQGLGEGQVDITEWTALPELSWWTYPLEDGVPVAVGTVAFTNFPSVVGLAPNLSGTLGVGGFTINDSLTVVGGVITFKSTGAVGNSATASSYATLTLLTGALTYTHSGYVYHLNGDPVSGMTIEIGESATPAVTTNTNASGYFSTSRTFDGQWSVYLSLDDSSDSKNDLPSVHGPDVITNLAATRNPWFPKDETLPDDDTTWGVNFSGHNDGRIDINSPVTLAGVGTNILQISAPYTKVVHDFDTSGWSVSGGTADLSIEGGKLKVVVTSGTPTITKDFSATSTTLAGARYADIIYTADDTEGIQWEACGHQWNISPTSYRVDLSAPDSLDLVSDTTAAALNNPTAPWAWGVRNPGTMKLIGLRNGKTYYFDTITLKRLTEAEGGSLDVYIYGHGPYVGSIIGDDRESDNYLTTMVAEPDPPRELIDVYEQSGIVLVDGVVAAELCSMHRWESPGSPSTVWYHEILSVNDDRFLTPLSGMVEKSYPTGTGTAYGTYLTPGWYHGHDSVSFSAVGYLGAISLPLEYPVYAFSLTKWLKGHSIIRVIDPGGPPGITDIIHRKYIRDGGVMLSEETLQTDPKGFVVTGPLDQPHSESWQITDIASDGTWVVVGSKLYSAASYVGCSLWFGLYEIGGPDGRFKTVASIDGTHLVLDSALPAVTGGYDTYIDSYCYPLDDYVHEFEVAHVNEGALLCAASDGSLLCATSGGDLLYGSYDPIVAAMQVRNHALALVTIKR
ncbi:MAG: hypothetical protein M1133_16340 [Armatimonadetes bacterium]|nr:hypothetical protein [Armatimonadota bacterium]